MKYANTVRQLPGGLDRGVRGWLIHVAPVPLVAVVLALCVDWLTWTVWTVSGHAEGAFSGWWGASQGSAWDPPGAAGNRLGLTSRDLTITIKGDVLTAQYTVTAPSKAALMDAVLRAGKSDTGDDLVDSVLGPVSVAEYRYGLTGSQYAPQELAFHGPRLIVGKGKATVTATSDPLRLFLHQQQITVAEPGGTAVKGPDRIHIRADAVQVSGVTGARLTGLGKNGADLRRHGQQADMRVSAGSGPDWLTGLRSTGGITIPVVNGPLSWLAILLYYGALFWTLVVIRNALPYSRVVMVARNIVFTVVAALASVAFITFLLDLGAALFHDPDPAGRAAAGPVALLVAGAALVWPIACLRTGRSTRPRRGRMKISRPAWLSLAAHLVIVCGYWLVLYLALRVCPLTDVPVLAGTAAVLILVRVLARRLFGAAGLTPRLVSAGMLTVALGATIAWPELYFNWFPVGDKGIPHVNITGKWVFLAVGVLTVLGLCLMAFRVAQALARTRKQQWLLTAGSAIAIGAAALPDIVTNARLADPHASGPAAADLVGLFTTVPQLLDWLLLALSIMVAMSIPARPDARPLARRIAIIIALPLLYWNTTWLYVPVTFIVGFVLLDRLVFPKWLAEATAHTQGSAPSVEASIAAWRHAESAAQQNKVLTSDGGALLDFIKEDSQRAESLITIQNYLGRERDRRRKEARRLEGQAFDQRGKVHDRQTAMAGAVVGAILGIIPTTITLITTHPALDSSGYPVLGFFGSVAWELFEWAGLGWLIGYSLPLMRGRNGSEKALWLFIAGTGATLPMAVVWSDGNDWLQTLIWSLELLLFLMAAAIYLCDLRTLKAAGRGMADWFTVQNWHFLVTWSTALLAALGTAFVTFLSSAATEIGTRAADWPNGTPAAAQNPPAPQQGSQAGHG